MLHGEAVELFVCLGPECLDGRSLAGVQHLYLDEGPVNVLGHLTAQGIYLADQVALGWPANGGVAGHQCSIIQVHGEQEGLAAYAGCCQGCLAAGVTCPNHNYIIHSENNSTTQADSQHRARFHVTAHSKKWYHDRSLINGLHEGGNDGTSTGSLGCYGSAGMAQVCHKSEPAAPGYFAVAITGGAHGKEINPNHPETPEEQAAQTQECYRLGASLVHVHVRRPDNLSLTTGNPADYLRVNALIREKCPKIIINNMTGEGVGADSEEARLASTKANPEVCSLDMGPLAVNGKLKKRLPPLTGRSEDIEWDNAVTNVTYSETEKYAKIMLEKGIKPELEVWHTGQFWLVHNLIDKGLVKPALHDPVCHGLQQWRLRHSKGASPYDGLRSRTIRPQCPWDRSPPDLHDRLGDHPGYKCADRYGGQCTLQERRTLHRQCSTGGEGSANGAGIWQRDSYPSASQTNAGAVGETEPVRLKSVHDP